MRIQIGALKTGLLVTALAVTGAAWAQAPASAPAGGQDTGPGMAPHRPPMERALGPGGPGGPRGDHGRWWNSQQAIDKFKLTDTQRKSMDDIYQQHKVTLVDLHASLEKAELAMEPLMKDDQPDEGKILAQIDRVAQARAELEKANARMLLGLRKELTPEQWKEIQADRAARRDGRDGPGNEMRKWHGRPGGPPPQVTPDGAPPPNPPGEEE
jgi:periplasmic protein CpxP/Spy